MVETIGKMQWPELGEMLETPTGDRLVQAKTKVESMGKILPSPSEVLAAKMSQEFRSLIKNYCATMIAAHELKDIHWGQLATRLGTKIDFVKEAAEAMNEDGSLWTEVLWERIRRAGASSVFTGANWQKLEAGAVAKLLGLLEAGRIADVGELLAVASTAKRSQAEPKGPVSPGQGANMTQVNVNFGHATPEGDLPAAGHKMTIDLSPRSAQALARVQGRERKDTRVIDGKMINADELRDLLAKRLADKELEPAALTADDAA